MDFNLIDCPHCECKGTCLIDNGNSCGTCLKKAKIKIESKIVQCSVCNGQGKFEPKTARLKGRMPFFIIFVVLIAFYLYVTVSLKIEERFDQIFPLVGSLTTMIVTFYFSKNKA